jgi:leucyl aminopeptidase
MSNKVLQLAPLLFVTLNASAQVAEHSVLADLDLLKKIGAPILKSDDKTNVGYSILDQDMENKLSYAAHEAGKCAGYEQIPDRPNSYLEFSSSSSMPDSMSAEQILTELAAHVAKDRRFAPTSELFASTQKHADIESALTEVSEDHIRDTVEFLSSFPTRVHNAAAPNIHVVALKNRIQSLIGSGAKVDLISHSSTRQKSLRVRLPGTKHANEVIVFGAHLDSINSDWSSFSSTKSAPGADDNASGAADLVEALRILSSRPATDRTIDFIWYAGEEAGLLGSAEIAKTYKAQGADVVAVLQLDMTLQSGDGEFVLGSMTDFTSAWLRSYLETLNSIYINSNIIEDQCGYGCSDHASWYRQGFPTIMPFESSFRNMNHKIHSANDAINSNSSFSHSAIFSRIALAMALDLGNSNLREGP